jgi:hypothetical protein
LQPELVGRDHGELPNLMLKTVEVSKALQPNRLAGGLRRDISSARIDLLELLPQRRKYRLGKT